KDLAGLKNLRALGLGFAEVTDVGLRELAGLTSLQTLDLSGTKDFTGTKVTDKALKALAGLKRLQTLHLRFNGEETDAGLKELAGLKSLQTLDLYATHVTDAGLKELAGLT